MPHMKNPAAGKRQGSSTVALQADFGDLSVTLASLQHSRAAERLARRFGMPIPTAMVVAELAGIGGAR